MTACGQAGARTVSVRARRRQQEKEGLANRPLAVSLPPQLRRGPSVGWFGQLSTNCGMACGLLLFAVFLGCLPSVGGTATVPFSRTVATYSRGRSTSTTLLATRLGGHNTWRTSTLPSGACPSRPTPRPESGTSQGRRSVRRGAGFLTPESARQTIVRPGSVRPQISPERRGSARAPNSVTRESETTAHGGRPKGRGRLPLAPPAAPPRYSTAHCWSRGATLASAPDVTPPRPHSARS